MGFQFSFIFQRNPFCYLLIWHELTRFHINNAPVNYQNKGKILFFHVSKSFEVVIKAVLCQNARNQGVTSIQTKSTWTTNNDSFISQRLMVNIIIRIFQTQTIEIKILLECGMFIFHFSRLQLVGHHSFDHFDISYSICSKMFVFQIIWTF